MRRALKTVVLKILGITWYRSVRRNYTELMEWLEHGYEFIDLKK